MALELAQAVFIPLILSPLAYYFGKAGGKRAGWLTFIILLYSTVQIILSASKFSSSDSYSERFDWRPFGEFGLKLDGLSLPFSLMITLIGTILSIYSIPYMVRKISIEIETSENRIRRLNRRLGIYYALYLLSIAGMLGTVLATNLIQFYVFFELMLLPAFFLVSEFGYKDRERVGLMFFIWTHAGALILLIALIVSGIYAGGFDYHAVSKANIPENIRVFLAGSAILGLLFKLSAFGLHIWVPYTYSEAPTPISALISSVMTGIGGYALIRILTFLLPSAYFLSLLVLGVWAVITMIYGALLALRQTDLKRLLAYSSISQMGYIIFGIASGQYFGIAGSVIFYVSGGFGKALLFMAVGAIILQTNTRDINSLGGLAKNLPITAIASMIGFLALMGIPPTIGFQAEWLLFTGAFRGALEVNAFDRLILAYIALTATIFTAGYSLYMMRRVFFGIRPQELKDVKEAPLIITLPLLILALLTILFGIYPNLLIDRLIPLTYQILR
ncbi:MAG: NADH-quinone oxidoreductase subunit M [Nitrososphaerales archaeon]